MRTPSNTTSQSSPAEDELLKDVQAARLIGMSTAWLRRKRLDDKYGDGKDLGPRWLKISKAVRYRKSDLMAYLESRPTGGGQ